jgi:AraC family transcriptional regulator of adaptative response/methylated-DNA-[protein]-cysteine methyltransferase
MERNVARHYATVERAIQYLLENFRVQPSLDDVAREVNKSPFHFQRIFTEWAGVSPKQFLQFLNINYAKSLLKKPGTSLFDTAFETGLSGTGRLHDLFIKIEGMTPGEYKNGCEQMTINYNFYDSPFGPVIAASTAKGVCYLAFFDDGANVFETLQLNFPRAKFLQRTDTFQRDALQFFSPDTTNAAPIKLHLRGTPFQLKVWEALLTIPSGKLCTYSAVAGKAGVSAATRAVATAIGDNPVAYLIPCHRVIRSTGIIGQYHWGVPRKAAMIGWEAARLSPKIDKVLHEQ